MERSTSLSAFDLPPLPSGSTSTASASATASATAAAKRRRLDQQADRDYASSSYTVAPTTSRARAAANKAAALEKEKEKAERERERREGGARESGQANGTAKDKEHVPLFGLHTLPPAALQRYLSRYGLLEPHGTLSYHHAVFPVPPLPVTLPPTLVGRAIAKPRAPASRTIASANGQPSQAAALGPRKRGWQDPKTPEFEGLTSYDDPDLVTMRLAAKVKAHYDEKTLVKEGETLTNFIFALRMRAHTLRATPPG